MRSMAKGTVAASLTLAVGCYQTVSTRIRSSELPKLSAEPVYSRKTQPEVLPASLYHLLDEHGRVVEIESPEAVVVGLRGDARSLVYRPPIVSSVSSDGMLAIADPFTGEITIPLRDVESVDVKTRRPDYSVLGPIAIVSVLLGSFICLAVASQVDLGDP